MFLVPAVGAGEGIVNLSPIPPIGDLSGIDTALMAEWQRRWSTSKIGVGLQEVVPTIGEV